MHSKNKHIFKEYDIRGKYPTEINEKICFEIGEALSLALKDRNKKDASVFLLKNCKKIAVARDMRKSSPQLARALCKGILSKGIDVDYIGMASTPALYWTTAKKEYMGGAMITASHNSSEFNGIKLCGIGASPIDPQKIFSYIGTPPAKCRKGSLKRKSYIEEYINFIKKHYSPKKNRHLKIAVDAAWAMASDEIPFILDKLNMDFMPICFGPTENFSNKDINPSNKGALDDLSKCIKKYKADIGIAFDGDADRVLFMNEEGELIDPEIIAVIIGTEIINSFHRPTNTSKAKIIVDVRSGSTSKKPLKKAGLEIITSRSGHLNIKDAMIKNKAVFGAETSGHYYFNIGNTTRYIATDNAMIAMLKVLSRLSSSQSPISMIAKKYNKFFKSRELNFNVKNPDTAIKPIEDYFSRNKKIFISHLDGLTIEFPDWRFNLRKSNTESEILRLNIEAKSEEILRKRIKEIKKMI